MPAPLFARCLTPVALRLLAPAEPADAAVDGSDHAIFDELVPLHRGLLSPPPGVGDWSGAARPPGPPLPREIYGTPYDDHLESEHFTINWAPGDADRAAAEDAADALELGWQTFIEESGWTPPVSSDRFFLWVMLDPELGGTGYTTVYFTDEYPEGYPVMYLNPTWASDEGFWRSLAIHEFHHTIQFAMRPEYGTIDEDWYWEASAGWASLHAEPDSSAIDYTVAWYADDAHLDAATANAGHEYGMMAFNAFIEAETGDGGAILRVWQGASDRSARWFDLLADETAQPIDELIANFSVAYANDTYSRTASWRDPARLDPASGDEHWAERLGSRSYRAESAGSYQVDVLEGDVVMATLEGPATVVDVEAGDTFTVTATADGDARWRLSPADPTGDDGADGADGSADGADGGSDGADGAPDDGASIDEDKGAAGCACSQAAGSGAGAWAVSLGLGLGWARRRQGRHTA